MKARAKRNGEDRILTCERCGSSKPKSEWPLVGYSDWCVKTNKHTKYCCSTKVRSHEQVQHDISTQSKDCTSCGERKPFSSFSPNNAAKDGRQTTCKSCRSAKVHSGQWHGNTRRQAQIDERSDGTITPELVMDIFSIKNCPCCDGYMERDDKVMDHIIPLKLDGLHSASNVMVLCWSCNAGKAARHPKEWLNMLRDDAAQRMRKAYAEMGLNFDE